MMGDIFKEDERRPALFDDAGDMWPEVARVLRAKTSPGDREWLARIACSEDIHDAAPWAAVEGGNVVPERSRIQGRVFHPCHEDGRRIGFPLDVTHSSISVAGDVQGEVEAGPACAQGETEQTFPSAAQIASGGMKSQVMHGLSVAMQTVPRMFRRPRTEPPSGR